MKTATNLNSATGSVLGLAELIGISHGKMRTLIGHLCAAGLITSESSNKGTAFRLTDRGEQVLNFTSADVDDFSTILSVIQRPFGIAILHRHLYTLMYQTGNRMSYMQI